MWSSRPPENLFTRGPFDPTMSAMRLDRLARLPAALAEIGPREITRVFPDSALITLPGEREDPLFLSTLLHGNETTSVFVLRELARRYADKPPPRSLMIFVGNVRAAAEGRRFLPGQPDFNRIWRDHEGPYGALAEAVSETARAAGVFASIDIHNNTGANPHYGCVASLRPADLHLAALFAPIGVYYQIPNSTQSIAFSHFCPALTVECGQSGDQAGVERALNLIERTMRLDAFPTHAPAHDALRLYETVGRVVVAPECSLSFGGAADVNFRADLGRLNFTPLAAGERWTQAPAPEAALRVLNEHGDDLTDDFLSFDQDAVRLRRAVTPSMVTQDELAIRQDCLCYFMIPRALR